jgi:AcrR family transcriptional regulator
MSRASLTPTPPAAAGRRERGKLERRRRIERAAREIFREKGYDAATTREIAERADVGKGTLFAYARDKRDLLMMIVNDELDDITETAFATLPKKASLLVQLVHILAPRYAFWGKDPDLSRVAVQETFAFLARPNEDGRQTETARFYAAQPHIVAKIAEIAAEQQRAGAITKRAAPELVARLILDIYLSEVRNWLAAPDPDVAAGVNDLRRVLGLAIAGLKP